MKHSVSSSPIISVVIPTYNRADLLMDALQSVCQQTLGFLYYEVIVIDNNSEDNTYGVTKEFCHCYPNVRYYLETRQGISYARNRGWKESQGKYIAYIDDDCKVPKQWLAVANDVIERVSPSVFGGPIIAFYNAPKPYWFKDSYGSHDWGNEAKILTNDTLFGGNIFFSRTVLENVGGFDSSLGMHGKEIGFGEETALQLLIRAKMPDQTCYYDPMLYVYHLVRAEKMTFRGMIRRRFVSGAYNYGVFHGNASLSVGRNQLLKKSIKILLLCVVDFTFGVLKRNRSQYPYIQNYFYEHTAKYISKLGAIYEQFRRLFCTSKV